MYMRTLLITPFQISNPLMPRNFLEVSSESVILLKKALIINLFNLENYFKESCKLASV